MKKKIFAAVLLTAAVCVPVYAEETTVLEEMPHVETDFGIYDLVGYDFYEYNGENHIIIFSEYENTTNENCYPTNKYFVKLFQDGVQLENDFSDYTGAGTQWENCKGASTEVQPGGKLLYKQEYALSGTSDIDFEVKQFMGDEILGTYTIVCGSEMEATPDYKALYEELFEKYEQLQSEYDALKAQ